MVLTALLSFGGVLMGQHFLLSKDARDLPLKKVMRMTEPGAYRLFKRARWPETNGEPY